MFRATIEAAYAKSGLVAVDRNKRLPIASLYGKFDGIVVVHFQRC